ncbi:MULTISPECIES: helix-turn-helix domain-containing protein [Deinococcus]|uniref:helix-turn-helix domain-containing protein n=1 Tax=Deinococcus TaxID=1298 RepID=UPI000A07BA76|nr:helix-turn-helix transcriptional regulator [Deinococcus proteolyticus]
MQLDNPGQERRFLLRRKEIGKRVRRIREERGWTQDTLAHISGLNRSYPYRIEEGLVDVRLSTLLKISEALEIDVVALLNDDT